MTTVTPVPLKVRLDMLLDEIRLTEAILDNPKEQVLVIDRRDYASFETVLDRAVQGINTMRPETNQYREPTHLVVYQLSDIEPPLPPAEPDDPGTVEFVVAHVRRSRGDQWVARVVTTLRETYKTAFWLIVKEDNEW